MCLKFSFSVVLKNTAVLAISLLTAWLFLYLFRPSDQPVTIFGRSFSDHETLGLLILVTVIVIFLTSVGSLLLSATLVMVGIVCSQHI
ncbi:hypothetical protein ACSBR2_006981 [Camellia fascicularis]